MKQEVLNMNEALSANLGASNDTRVFLVELVV
jgi:hypothetical protein